MKESLKKDFIDEKGNEHIVILEGNKANFLGKKNYKLQHEFKNSNMKAKGLFTSDIGIHSSGFAGIFGLAMIVVVAVIIIAYLLLRF